MSCHTIKQGDACFLRLELALGGETVTAEDLPLLHCVEFMLGDDLRKVWPEDGDFADGAFLVPLTQAETFALPEDEVLELDVRVHFASGDVVGLRKKQKIRVVDALSEVTL